VRRCWKRSRRMRSSAAAVARESSLRWKRRAAIAGLVAVALAEMGQAVLVEAQAGKSSKVQKACERAIFEGDVRAGEGFEKVFTKGLKFYLEPLRSGWIVRVLAVDEPREAHDYAELATPPYRSVSPLLIGTDWSFRAQDAVGWNPRRFRYAGSRADFRELAGLYDGVMRNNAASSSKAAALVSEQPEGVLQILDARIVPGLADQARMAAAVASHFGTTPHTVDQSVLPTPLGAVQELRFRVELDLLPGSIVTKGLTEEKIVCPVRPTSGTARASQQWNK
jgi:hypothetical protein